MFEGYLIAAAINVIVLLSCIAYYEVKKYSYRATDIQMGIMWFVVAFVPMVNFVTAFFSSVFFIVTGSSVAIDSLSGISWKIARKLNGRKGRQ